MNHSEQEPQRSEDLRREAEARLHELEDETEEIVSEVDARALVHELQVHQIELTMQNEELLRARAQAEDTLAKYTDLYDFAPIGYFALNHQGVIVECNLAGAELLGKTRSELINDVLRSHVARQSLVPFEECLRGSFETSEKQTCELRLQRGGMHGAYVRLVLSPTIGSREEPRLCRAAMIDISELNLVQSKLRRSYDELEDRVRSRTAELAQAREESERRAAELQAVLASMADGVILSDTAGDVTFVNDAGMEILGAHETEDFEDWANRFERYTLDGQPISTQESSTSRAARGEVVRDMRMIGVTPWGKKLMISASASPVRDAEGRILGAITIFHDIEQHVQFERQREQLLERERHIAGVLQQALVPPQRHYEFECCSISVDYLPASDEAGIGGDFYDVFELGDGRFGIVVGDITGKGLQAAFRVGAIRHSIRSYAYLDPSPAKVMTLVNDAMCRGQEDAAEMLTAFYGVVDASKGEIIYTSAGHEPPFIRHRGGSVTEPNEFDRALGMMPGHTFSEFVYQLDAGDLLVVTTDGITEAMDPAREFFGREGIVGYLRQTRSTQPEDVAAGLLNAATSYAKTGLRDDVAILALKFKD